MAERIATMVSLFDLMTKYPTKQEASDCLERIQWGDSPFCTKCGSCEKIKAQAKHPGRYWCGQCRSYFTVRAGTPLESAKVDVRKWLFAAYLLIAARKGISAMQLSKELSISYPTAWYMLHRLRLGHGTGHHALRGMTEADETYVGGKEGNKQEHKKLRAGRGTVGEVEIDDVRERSERVVAKPVEKVGAPMLVSFIEGNVEPGTTVYTGEAPACERLTNPFVELTA